ncbi:MAG: helix-turn-helix transcriptional regulator [Blautia sp.]|nr:helix-turn-helix transcriptional regulator [Blautia sp.]
MNEAVIDEGMIIKTRRKELRLSQQEVAAAIGVELRQYQRFEYGERLVSHTSFMQGLRICAALELDPYGFVFGSGPVLFSSLPGRQMPAPLTM